MNTHRLSIHIYKEHSSFLGPAGSQPSNEAKFLYDAQLNKSKEIENIKKRDHDEEADNDDEDEEIDEEITFQNPVQNDKIDDDEDEDEEIDLEN